MRRPVYILATVAAAVAVVLLIAQQMRFAIPAPLHRAHEGLGANCFACHTEDQTVSVATCTGCHTDPATGQTLTLTGFARHHAYEGLDCLTCHTEHKGSDGDLTRPGHSFTETDCSTCHERHVGQGRSYQLKGVEHPKDTLHRDHARWQEDCTACHHEDGGLVAQRCASCHEPGTDRPVVFQGFAAHHTYADLDCLGCHLEHRGRGASVLRPGTSIQVEGCALCHRRHVGSSHAYALAGDRHPGPSLHPDHAPWAKDCTACHGTGEGRYECATCHDPVSGKQVELKGFAAHHFRRDLPCLDCHTDHRGAGEHATTRKGKSFADIACESCHAADLQATTHLDRVAESLRGNALTFRHVQHPKERLACKDCHPMQAGKPHTLSGAYDRHCSDCHHDRQQQAGCRTCHAATADYFAGRLDGDLVGRGTHGRSGEVGCADCHVYDAGTHRFAEPKSTCAACHPKAYLAPFVKAQTDWQAWRAPIEDGKDDTPAARRQRFIARNWYHNDTHATAQRAATRNNTRQE